MGRYHWTSLRNHPLQPSQEWKRVPSHRIVLWEKVGPGPHPCHWCGSNLDWSRGTGVGILTVDHLDNDSRNNSPDNLVPSCHSCNCGRHAAQRVNDGEAWVTMTGNRGRHRADERNCKHCGTPFLHIRADKRSNRGIYCSRSCARRG